MTKQEEALRSLANQLGVEIKSIKLAPYREPVIVATKYNKETGRYEVVL